MSNKQRILSGITEALKNKSELSPADDSASDRIESYFKSITPLGNSGLWEKFKIELENIAGEYKSFSTSCEAVQFIQVFLEGIKCKSICVDDSNLVSELKERIIEKNVAVVRAASLNSAERKKIISEMNCAVVGPSFAVADIGSLAFMMDDTKTSYPHFLCDNTIAIIKKENIAANQFELFEKIDIEKTNNMFFVTGPSRTADIEKVLVLGAHGPRRLIVITID